MPTGLVGVHAAMLSGGIAQTREMLDFVPGTGPPAIGF